MSKKVVQKVVLGGVILNRQGKVLILQRHDDEDVLPGMWELPSGKKEPLEKSEESLLREIEEETGLDTKIIIPFSVFDYQIEKDDEVRDSTQINYLMRFKKGKVRISSEHQDYAWIDKKQISKYDISSNTREVISKAFNLKKLLNG